MAPLPCRALPGRIVEGTPCMGKAVVPFFEKPDCVGRKGVHKTGIVGCDKELRVMGALVFRQVKFPRAVTKTSPGWGIF